jgi:hypothetical protein
MQEILSTVLFPVSCLLQRLKLYKNILPVVLYGCETWSLTLR